MFHHHTQWIRKEILFINIIFSSTKPRDWKKKLWWKKWIEKWCTLNYPKVTSSIMLSILAEELQGMSTLAPPPHTHIHTHTHNSYTHTVHLAAVSFSHSHQHIKNKHYEGDEKTIYQVTLLIIPFPLSHPFPLSSPLSPLFPLPSLTPSPSLSHHKGD